MDDLISREAAVAIMQAKGEMAMGTPANVFYCAAHMLEMMPAVDAEPVRHGKWVYHDDDIMPYKSCSLCGCEAFDLHGANYCPYCGAKMGMEKEELE